MPRYTFEQFAAVRNYTDLSFSPDGEQVAYVTNASGQLNVWRQPVAAGPGGAPLMPVQLTALVENSARRAIWSPVGDTILTVADRHGNENFQIFSIPAERGWLYPITDTASARHELGGNPWSPDGRRMLFACNARNPADMDVLVRDMASGETAPVVAGGANYFPGAWSPDGSRAVVLRLNSNTDQDVFIHDFTTGETAHITPHEGEAKFFPGPWKRDGSGIYLISDQGREFQGLAFYRPAAGELEWLETPEWDVQSVAHARDGHYLAWVVNENGYGRLFVRDLESGAVRDYPELPRGVIGGLAFAPGKSLLGLYVNRPVAPAELLLLDLETGATRCLSQSALGGIDPADLVEPEAILYDSHDGRRIPAFLYKPRGIASGAAVPVVLSIHGGPEAQEQPSYAYNGFYQYLLDRGIGVLAPNIRGSTGYGKTYQKLIHRDWGGAELGDLEYAAKYLQSLDWVDPERLGVFGGSFGGFATLSCVARLPDYWAAAVDIVGPSNLLTFTRSVPPFWRRLMRDWIGDPEDDADQLMARSPITYVDQVRAPLLVIQGANDPRVVQAESDQMVERLRARGQTVEYLVFADEGHGFTKTANSLKAFRATGDWFERHLLGVGGSPAAG